jgi:biopolymer transport protein ExbB/TolQ
MVRKGLSFGLAAFLWIACAFELAMLVVHAVRGTLAQARLVGSLLSQPALADRVVPIAVLAVLAWILLQVLSHAVRIAREQNAVQRLRGRGFSQSFSEKLRAGRRSALVGRYASSPGKLAEALPAASALDGAAVDNAYTVLKAYVWTLPVLGFIGTAWGMAQAIGGFSEGMTAARVNGGLDVALLTDRLAQVVIPGLAHAFSITMLALGASVIAHFWVTTLQAWDQEALDGLDRLSIESLADASPAHAGEGIPGELLPLLADRLSALTEEVHALSGKLDLMDAGQHLKQAGAALAAAAKELVGAAAEVKTSVKAPYHITIRREGEK